MIYWFSLKKLQFINNIDILAKGVMVLKAKKNAIYTAVILKFLYLILFVMTLCVFCCSCSQKTNDVKKTSSQHEKKLKSVPNNNTKEEKSDVQEKKENNKNDDVILFTALPKRIEVDGENMIELFQYQHNSLLGGCYDLKQTNKCKFDEFHFEYDNKKYYDIEDVELLLSNL